VDKDIVGIKTMPGNVAVSNIVIGNEGKPIAGNLIIIED
jgi:hypothetical protein